MKKAFVVVLLLLLILVMAAPAGAAKPENLNFDIDITYPNFPYLDGPVGTWSSSGLVDSVGILESEPTHFGAGSPPGKPFQTAHQTIVIADDQGSITIKSQIHGFEWTFDGPVAHFKGDGQWVIISGTDAYENLRGQGKVSANGYANFFTGIMTTSAKHEGQGHFDPQ